MVSMQGRHAGPRDPRAGGRQPGTVDVPLRFAVVREGVDPKMITTKLDRVAVTIPPDDSNVLFTHVTEGLDFPMPRGGDIDYYVVYVGFDPAGRGAGRKKPAPKPKPRAAKPSRRPAKPRPRIISGIVATTSRAARRPCS